MGSLLFLTASLTLVIEISTRFLSDGPADTTGVVIVMAQSMLTLLAGGGALTKRMFQKMLDKKESSRGISC